MPCTPRTATPGGRIARCSCGAALNIAVPEPDHARIRRRPILGGLINEYESWKIIIPTDNATPEPRAHAGYEWIYVLSGHTRLVLGDRDWVLGRGEVASFDTAVPHWFGSTGDEPAEILSIFERPGERSAAGTSVP